MKLTNGEIFSAKVPLQQLTANKFPVKTSLALVKLIQKLNEFLVPIEQVRDGLIKTYGKPDPENRQQIKVEPSDENWAKFAEEFKELMTQEVEVVVEKVPLPDTLEIEPAIIMALEKFITVA